MTVKDVVAMETKAPNTSAPSNQGGSAVPFPSSNDTKGLTFNNILSQVNEKSNPEKLLAEGLKTSAEDTLRARRKSVISEINDAMHAGDNEGLRKLQGEYDELTAELRARCSIQTASINHPSVSDASPNESFPKKALPISVNSTSKSTTPQQESVKLPVSSEQAPSNVFGVDATLWNKVCKDELVHNSLLSMPQDAVDLYKEISPAEKRDLAKQVNGKTHYLFFTIDNREAFIKGQVMGRDAFGYLQDAIDQQIKDGKVSFDEGLRRKSGISIIKSLTPPQREGFLKLIEAEIDLSRSSKLDDESTSTDANKT